MKESKFIFIFVSFILISCSGNKIVLKNSCFNVNHDPIYSATADFIWAYELMYYAAPSKFMPSFLREGRDSSFLIKLHLDKKKYERPQSIDVFDTTDNKLVYKRELEEYTGGIYKSSFSAYNTDGNCYLDCSISFEITTDTDLKDSEIDYCLKEPRDGVTDYLMRGWIYHYEPLNGYLKLYSETGTLSKVVTISDDIVQETEYWQNGKEKLVKKFDRKTKELLDVFNYSETGDPGIPMECVLCGNDGWMAFQSNRYDSNGQIYLLLKATREDYHVGAAIFVSSADSFKSSYYVNAFGKYQFNEDGSTIQFSSMTNTDNFYHEDRWKMSVNWSNTPNDIEVSGLYHNLTFNFAYTPSVTDVARISFDLDRTFVDYIYFPSEIGVLLE